MVAEQDRGAFWRRQIHGLWSIEEIEGTGLIRSGQGTPPLFPFFSESDGYRGRSPFSSAGHPMRKSISPPAVEPEVESKSVAEDKLGVDTESRRTPGSNVSEQ